VNSNYINLIRIFIIFGVIFVSGCVQDQEIQRVEEEVEIIEEGNKPPTNLALPLDIEDIGTGSEFFSPFGVIRKLADKGHGHGGIDVPAEFGSPVYAVADGTIVENYPATDNRGGDIVKLIISEGDREGEGWGFLYEHIKLEPGLDVGNEVKKGQQIGTTMMTTGNNHMQLSYWFNNQFEYSRDSQCWIDNLDPGLKEVLVERFLDTNQFGAWETAIDDGMLPLKELLDTEKFPDGPQLCYPLGLDVRVLP